MAFKRNLISSGVAAALMVNTVPVMAQVLEEVVITGIRSSLKAAMDTKRDSAGVVDAITSEDIGKFPDTNLAESLQRITGVSIDRDRGEGSKVTVRGFGADFNLITLNGRQMPTHSGTGRAFDFGDIASESVSSVEVYKTGRASVATGGIGATINVKTLKPLDKPGTTLSFGTKAVQDESTADGDKYTPEISGLWSQTFLDDTVGIAIAGTFQERNNGQAGSSNTQWFERDGTGIADNGQQNNLPSAGDIVGLPQQIVYTVDEWERERINGQITLQWRPIETVTATLDYTYAELELDHRSNNMSIWFSPTAEAVTWSDGPVVSPLLYSETNNNIDFPMGAAVDASRNERNSVGFNLQWDATERLSFELDYHDSKAEREPNSKYGSSAVISIASFERQAATVDYSSEIPVTTTVTNDPLTPDDMQIAGSVFTNEWAEMNIEQTQLKARFDWTDDTSIDFGVGLSDLDNFDSKSGIQRDNWGQNQASAYGSIADLLVPASLSGIYDELSGGDQINNNFFLFDMAAIAERGELLEQLPVGDSWHLPVGTRNAVGDCGTGFCADSNPGFGNQLNEETVSVYFQVNHAGIMFDRDYNIVAGYRYEKTDVTASAESENYERIEWSSVNEFNAIASDTLTSSSLEDSYSVGLPSIDFDIDITDDIKLRASYSETIARSSFEDLRGNLTIGQILRVVQGQHTADGTLGNPGLKPHESENWDVSAEWYYGETSYVSVGYFDKSVDNFVTNVEGEDVILYPGLAHPALGPLYQDAIGSLGITATNSQIRDYIFTNSANEPGVDVANLRITGVPGRDGDAFFDVDTKINSAETAEIDGWEVAWQHDFGASGFGFIANATFVDGSAVFNNLSDEPQFALPGLSDTRNFIGYYDKNGIQVRLAYNWRDEFFTGGVTQPSYTEEYEQWDANASYEVTDQLTVFVEGINLTNETQRTHARSANQVNGVNQSGPRYAFGARYTY
ncbi:MAG: TonB-dependent receptor [Halieaceae bacterium]|jgi:TonB-dependent receptor